MDAQFSPAPREIWQIFEDLKELHVAQFEQAERIAQLERRRDEDARLKSVWGPLSPFPTPLGGPIPTDPPDNSPHDAFKGFDQGQPHHGMSSSAMAMETYDEPRRGASRANSVRFDESAIHGYGQANRANPDLPLRTGSGIGSFQMTERTLSHRSDGRLSSSGHSLHSARTNSMGLETSRFLSSSYGESSPVIPPPGWALLGPVPSIVRCWLTTHFSNDTVLYAAVCSGSYMSTLGISTIHKLGLEDLVVCEDGKRFVKMPVYLTEASIHQTSSRSGSPEPQVPALTVRFFVRETNPAEDSIDVIIGSDVLLSHGADILLSKNKIIMLDDERNLVSIPLVRPEKESAFMTLLTAPNAIKTDHKPEKPMVNGKENAGAIGKPKDPHKSMSAPASARASVGNADEVKKPRLQDQVPAHTDSHPKPAPASDTPITSKPEPAGAWQSWRHPKPDPIAGVDKIKPARPMKVLRPTKLSNRAVSYTPAATEYSDPLITAPKSAGLPSTATQHTDPLITAPKSAGLPSTDINSSSVTSATNPVGVASAFGWLNSYSNAARTR